MHELNLMDTVWILLYMTHTLGQRLVSLSKNYFFLLWSFFVCLWLHVTMKKRLDSHKQISLFGTFARIDRLDGIFENIKIFRRNQIPTGITCH